MGRAPCCEKVGLTKGPWTPEEDQILISYIQKNGHGSWRTLPKLAGLLRCGKSCRLRWTNYLRPDIKRGPFTEEEERNIIQLHALLGNKWSAIASQLPGRTDNEIKNYWNTHLKKRLLRADLDSAIHTTGGFGCAGFPCISASCLSSLSSSSSSSWMVMRHLSQWENARLQAEARHSSKDEPLFRALGHSSSAAPVDCFLKVWNSEVGRAFREGANRNPPQGSPNNNVNPSSNNNNQPCSRSMPSLCSVSTMNNTNNEDGHHHQQRQQHPGSLGCLNNGNQYHHHQKSKNEEEYNSSGESERANNLNDARHYRELAELLFDFSSADENDIVHNGSSGNQNAHVFGTDLNKEFLEHSEWDYPDLDLEASRPDQEDKDYWKSMLSI